MSAAIGDVIRVALEWLVAADTFVNVMHMLVEGIPGGGSDDGDLMGGLKFYLENTLLPTIEDDLATGIVTYRLTGKNLTQDYIMPEVLVDFAGTAAEDTLPSQTSAEVLFGTGKPRTVGRTYLPPMLESLSSSAGEIDVSALVDLAEFAEAMIAVWTPGDYAFQRVIYSRENGTYEFPTTWGVPVRWRTQRRRRIGKGS